MTPFKRLLSGWVEPLRLSLPLCFFLSGTSSRSHGSIPFQLLCPAVTTLLVYLVDTTENILDKDATNYREGDRFRIEKIDRWILFGYNCAYTLK